MRRPAPTWQRWPYPESDIEALFLGEIPVGRVHHNLYGERPAAIVNLNAVQTGAFWQAFRTVEAAKAHVELQVALWLRRAGLD